jgi:hypothetical protein
MKEHTRTQSIRPRRIVRWGVPALALGALALDAAAQENRPTQDERPITETRPDRATTQTGGMDASGGALAAELQRINSDFRARVTQYFQNLDPQKSTGVNPTQLLITSVDSSTVVAGIAADESLMNRGRGETQGARGVGADRPERDTPGNVAAGRPDLDGAPAGDRQGQLLGFLFISGPGLKTRSLGVGISAREFDPPGSAAGNLAPGQSLPTGFYDVRTGPGMRNLQLVDERGQVVTTIPFGGMAARHDRGAMRDGLGAGRDDDGRELPGDDDRARALEAGAPRGDLGRPTDLDGTGMPHAAPEWAAVYATILRELAPDFGLSRG